MSPRFLIVVVEELLVFLLNFMNLVCVTMSIRERFVYIGNAHLEVLGHVVWVTVSVLDSIVDTANLDSSALDAGVS